MAAVIKATPVSEKTSEVSPENFGFEDISQPKATKADVYLDGVRQHAAEIISSAHTEVSRIRQEAYLQGQQAAQEHALSELKPYLDNNLETLSSAMAQAIETIVETKHTWLREWETQAVHMAIQIAERVIRREIKRTPDISLQLIQETLELATGCSNVVLHLHPKDFEVLGDRIEQLTSRINSLGTVEVVSDDQTSRGGCLVKTQFGSIDQQIETQLLRIEEELSQ